MSGARKEGKGRRSHEDSIIRREHGKSSAVALRKEILNSVPPSKEVKYENVKVNVSVDEEYIWIFRGVFRRVEVLESKIR